MGKVISIKQISAVSEKITLSNQKIKPDFIAVTREDSSIELKERTAELVGAKVVGVTNLVKGYSTGRIIKSA